MNRVYLPQLRLITVSIVAICLVAMAVMLAKTPAEAQKGPSMYVKPMPCVEGQEVTAFGSGFPASSVDMIHIYFIWEHGGGGFTHRDPGIRQKVATAIAPKGAFSVNFKVPSGVKPGNRYLIQAYNDQDIPITGVDLNIKVPEIDVLPDTVEEGSSVAVTGTGFPAVEKVSIEIIEHGVIDTVSTDSFGNFAQDIDIAPGIHGAITVRAYFLDYGSEAILYVEKVSTPTYPAGGILEGMVGETLLITAKGAASNLGHDIEYQFDWGDGSFSVFSSNGAYHNKWEEGTYNVRARARCATHKDVDSGWSQALIVRITAQKTLEGEETLSRELQSGTVSYIKLINDAELIGFASYSQTDNGNEMQLHKLYIHPRFQRMGYGSALLRYVHERAVQGGYKHLILAVNKNNRKAISAYLKNGFVIKESMCVDIGNGFYRDDHIMKRNLRP